MVTPEKFLKAYLSVLPNAHPRDLARQRGRLSSRRSRRTGFAGRWVLATTLLAAAALVLRFAGDHEQVILSAHVAERSVAVGESVESDHQPSAVEFSDGTRLDLASDSKVQVAALTDGSARLVLERGELTMNVRKHQGLHWSVHAGQYQVSVIGTKFTVQWDEALQDFSVNVHEGVVRVEGGRAAREGVVLTSGKSFQEATPSRASGPAQDVLGSESTVDAKPATMTTSSAALAHASRDFAHVANDKTRAETPSTKDAARVDSARPWQSEAREGHYREALQLALAAGGVDLVPRLNVEELLLLGHTARFGGRADVARAAYLGVRTRFPAAPQAPVAAFSLGRLGIDDQHDAHRAVRWFETYLSEAPTGKLAAGARSRLMDLYVRAGDLQKARRIARDYMLYYPTGPHSTTARALAETSSARSGDEQSR